MSDPDVIDTLAGIEPGSPLAVIRDRKPVTREQAQATHPIVNAATSAKARCAQWIATSAWNGIGVAVSPPVMPS